MEDQAQSLIDATSKLFIHSDHLFTYYIFQIILQLKHTRKEL